MIVGDAGPIAGATVRLAGPAALRELTSDTDGAFDFGPQVALSYVVAADAPGFTPASQRVNARDPLATPEHLKLVLHACEAWIRGTVRDIGGGAIVHARVGVDLDVDADITTGVETDDHGAFELCVPVGPTSVVARAEGYASERDAITASGRIRHDFTLGPEATVAGHVVRRGDHAPVANAIVELHAEQGQTSHATTDTVGRFSFDSIAPGRYAITAIADQMATARPLDVVAEVGKSHDESVELAPTYEVAGRVVEAGTQTGVPGVEVRLFTRTGVELRRMTATTQADGSFAIPHMSPGKYGALIDEREPINKDARDVTVEARDTNIVFQIDRSASIAGRVVRNGKPVEGAFVNVSGAIQSCRSDADGRFTARGLRAGTHRIYAESERLGAFTQGPEIDVAKGEHKEGVEIDLELAGVIAGRVLDQDGAGVGGAMVQFSLVEGRDYATVSTGDDGRFVARGLSGGGSYVYVVHAAESEAINYLPVAGGRFSPVALRDGASRVDGLEIRVRIERLAIAGRVTDASGGPLADVVVRALPVRDYGIGPSTRSDATGAFEIKGLVNGTYDVVATSVDGETREAKVAAGRRGLVLSIAGAGAIDGTLTGFTGAVEVLALSDSFSARALDAITTGPTFRIERAPAGRYRVIAHSAKEGDAQTIQVSPGAPTKIAMKARGFASVSGTLRDRATNEPIAGATCRGESPDSDFLRYLDRKFPEPSKTGADGAYHVDSVVAGLIAVSCDRDEQFASASMAVEAGDAAHLDVFLRTEKRRQTWSAGIVLADQFGESIVSGVEKGGPGDRAGVRPGDIVTKLDDRAFGRHDAYIIKMSLDDLEASPVALTVERGGKHLVLTLSLASP